MATPAWVRKRRQRQHAETTAIRAELFIQSLERVEQEETKAAEQWTPRRGMSFASETVQREASPASLRVHSDRVTMAHTR